MVTGIGYVTCLLSVHMGSIQKKGQRSLRGHFRFYAKKLKAFFSPELNIVECFTLNWNNAFLCFACVFFFIEIKGR